MKTPRFGAWTYRLNPPRSPTLVCQSTGPSSSHKPGGTPPACALIKAWCAMCSSWMKAVTLAFSALGPKFCTGTPGCKVDLFDHSPQAVRPGFAVDPHRDARLFREACMSSSCSDQMYHNPGVHNCKSGGRRSTHFFAKQSIGCTNKNTHKPSASWWCLNQTHLKNIIWSKLTKWNKHNT